MILCFFLRKVIILPVRFVCGLCDSERLFSSLGFEISSMLLNQDLKAWLMLNFAVQVRVVPF